MGKFLKSGKAVVLLQGRYAGRKAIIVKNFDDGNTSRPYGHALVVGVDRYPLKVTKGMGKKRLSKRSRVKPFIKIVNYNHVMPTRYSVDVDLKQVVSVDALKDPASRNSARKEVKKLLTERYLSGKNAWFFQKLAF